MASTVGSSQMLIPVGFRQAGLHRMGLICKIMGNVHELNDVLVDHGLPSDICLDFIYDSFREFSF